MNNLYETIRCIVQQEMRQLRTAELAVVQEQHPHASDSDTDNYACTVVLRNSGLVLTQVPVATQNIGQANIPNVGDLVLVQFLGGDINGPIITGRLYNDEDRPPLNEDGQTVLNLPLGAEESDAVRMTLTSGDQRALSFALGNGLEINLHDDDPVVEILVDGDKGAVQIDRDGAITIKSSGNIKVESDGNINMKGIEISVEASSQLNLKGGTVNIN